MTSFGKPGLTALPLTHGLAQTLRALGEYKGRQELFQQQTPQALHTLLQVAVIQSTESSNRIEGVIAPPKRIQQLVAEKTVPRNRPEQEILEYRDVLNTIHASALHMPFTPSLVQQLHRDLFQYTVQAGGVWKPADNKITEKRPDGAEIIRFTPTPAYLTPIAMNDLHQAFSDR